MTRRPPAAWTHRIIRPAPSVVWAVETMGVRIIDTASGSVSLAGYPGAAVWDMLMQGYSRKRISQITAILDGCSIENAILIVETCIAEWKESGFFVEEVPDG